MAEEIEKGVWDSSGEDPKLHIISGDWTVHQAEGSLVKYRVKSGNLTVEAQDGKTYRGGTVELANESTLTIQGDGIWNLYWGIFPYTGEWQCGTVRFMNGTVFNASAPAAKRVEIHGGNINYDVRNSQAIYGADGNRVFKSAYDTSACAPDTLTDISINQVINAVQSSHSVDISPGSGFYLLNKKFYLWMQYSEFLGGVSFQPSDDTPYVADVTEVETKSYNLTPPIRLADFTVNGYRSFYKTVGDSITLTAGTLTNEQRMDSKRVEWFYTDPHEASGESHAIDCNELSYTISALTEDDDLRTYTCKVYQINGDEERELGTYTATIYTMKWQSSNTEIPGAIGTSVTLEANAVEGSDGNWLEGFDSIWEIDKNDGQGWQQIAGAIDESYVLSVESQDVQNWKFRRHLSAWVIGNLNIGAISQYFAFYSPEITVTLNPTITQQPRGMTVQVNDPTTHSFTVQVANATSTTMYQWQRKVGSDFLPINSNDLPVSGEDSATLTFTSMRSDLTGEYRCAVSNETAVTYTKTASLYVKQPPAVASITQNAAANAGRRAVIAANINEGIVAKNVGLIWQYSTDGGNNWTNVTSTNTADNIHIETQMRDLIAITIRRWDSDTGQYVTETVRPDDEYLSSSLVINRAMAHMDGLMARCVLSDAFGEYPSSNATLTVEEDTTAPTGTISIGTSSWSSFQDTPTFGTFYNTDQVMNITASDSNSGVEQIAYHESTTALTYDDVAALPDNQWTAVAENATTANATITAADTKQFICYVRIKDAAGNIAYLSTNGGTFDTTAPIINGVENDSRYFAARQVSVVDTSLKTVTLNGETVSNSFTLPGNEDADHTIVATDTAGNSTTVVVHMRKPASQSESVLSLDGIAFSVMEGYTQPAPQPLIIANTGNTDAVVERVEVDNDNFIVSTGDNIIEGGSVNDSWTIQPVSGLSAGSYVGRVTITYNNNKRATATASLGVQQASLSVTVPRFDPMKEGAAAPAAQSIAINNAGFESINITSVEICDSDAFVIDSTPLASSTIGAGETSSGWTVQPTEGLSAGTYTGRVFVTAENGIYAEATIAIHVTTPRLTLVAPVFARTQEGYTQPEAEVLEIANEGDAEANISRVHVVDSQAFIAEEGETTIAPGNVITSWAIRPVVGLSEGTHSGKVRVEYDNGKIAEVPISFIVERSAQENPGETGSEEEEESSTANTNDNTSSHSNKGKEATGGSYAEAASDNNGYTSTSNNESNTEQADSNETSTSLDANQDTLTTSMNSDDTSEDESIFGKLIPVSTGVLVLIAAIALVVAKRVRDKESGTSL